MTNFGFNTDIKYGDTVYHVQSEERRHDSQLQTQVFVRGRCIGKYSSSYTSQGERDDLEGSDSHELLKTQHRTIVEAVRAGKIEEFLQQSGDSGTAADAEIAFEPATPERAPLELKFLNPESIYSNDAVSFRFEVCEGPNPVEGAKLACRFQTSPTGAARATTTFLQATTAANGSAQISLDITEADLPQASLLVQASHNGRVVTRKFRLREK